MITWHVLLLKIQDLISDEQYERAARKAKKLLRFYSKHLQNLDGHQAQIDIMTVYCKAIFKEKNPHTACENISFIEGFLERRFTQSHDTTEIKNTLMAPHLLCPQFSQSEIDKKVDKYYKNATDNKLIKELIYNQEYSKFLLSHY